MLIVDAYEGGVVLNVATERLAQAAVVGGAAVEGVQQNKTLNTL